MFVCICHAVPETTVADAAAAGLTAAEIAHTTKAGTSCGCCADAVASIIARSKRCERTGGPCTGCTASSHASRIRADAETRAA